MGSIVVSHLLSLMHGSLLKQRRKPADTVKGESFLQLCSSGTGTCWIGSFL